MRIEENEQIFQNVRSSRTLSFIIKKTNDHVTFIIHWSTYVIVNFLKYTKKQYNRHHRPSKAFKIKMQKFSERLAI